MILPTGWKDALGKVATIKTKSGLEIIGSLFTLTDDMAIVEYPYVVVLGADGDTVIVPYQFTSNDVQVPMDPTGFLSVCISSKTSADGYNQTIEERKQKEGDEEAS